MKNKISLLLFCLLTINAVGQEATDSTIVKEFGKKNVVKFLPVNLLFNTTSFEYERKFSKQNSLILGVGLPVSKSFPGKLTNNSGENKISNDAFSTTSFRIGYRHYSGSSIQPSAFYLSPYLKYQKFIATTDNLRTVTKGTPPVTKNFSEHYDINGNTLNFGLQWGVQFLIAKIVSVDFYFLGLEAGLASVTATVKSSDTNMIDEVETSVRNKINDLPSLFAKKITVTRSGADQVDVKGSSMPYPWLRSGISIGIAF